MKIVFAFCTYNRADRLKELVGAIRHQYCSEPFEILVVNNNSTDNTIAILDTLAAEPGIKLRHVNEPQQGISHARNRALEEAMSADFLYFMDDDELPQPGLLAASIDALANEGADCTGGRIINYFEDGQRPKWLGDELLGFLAEINHGDETFWIEDESTPIWTSNVAYRMELFRSNPGLRFDVRYSREGKGVGGGEDVIMLKKLLDMKAKIRYRPDMVVEHRVETWRLSKIYFLKLHFTSGMRTARYELKTHSRTLFGAPYFMYMQAVQQTCKALWMTLKKHPERVRQGMNASHVFGMIYGCYLRKSRSTAAAV